MNQEPAASSAVRTRGKCWFFLQQIKLHGILIALVIFTVLLTVGWLACAIGGIVRSDIGSPGMFELPFYYMLTSTGLTVFVAISATTTIIVGMNGLAKLQKDEKTAYGRRPSEMVYDTVDNNILKGMSSTKLRGFSIGTIFLIFLGVFLALLSVLIAFWSITIAYNFEFLLQETPLRDISVATVIAPVVLVEIMIGLVVPVLFSLSVVPINSVLRFVTYDRVDIRKIMPKLIPFISYTVGKKRNYWVAISTFYFPIRDDYDQTYEVLHKRKWYHLCDTNKSTVIIFLILAFNFLLSWTVFVNGTLVHEFNPQSCRELSNSERERAVCILTGNVSLVNCTASDSNSIEGSLLCFQFLRFSEQTDIFMSLTGAVVLYFIATAFISLMLEIVRFLYLFHKSWIWAICVILFGVGIIGGDVALILASLVWNIARFELDKIFKYLIIGIDIILVGVLLLISQPLELAPVNWKPDTLQDLEEIEETALNGKSIEEGKVKEMNNLKTNGSSQSSDIDQVFEEEEEGTVLNGKRPENEKLNSKPQETPEVVVLESKSVTVTF